MEKRTRFWTFNRPSRMKYKSWNPQRIFVLCKWGKNPSSPSTHTKTRARARAHTHTHTHQLVRPNVSGRARSRRFGTSLDSRNNEIFGFSSIDLTGKHFCVFHFDNILRVYTHRCSPRVWVRTIRHTHVFKDEVITSGTHRSFRTPPLLVQNRSIIASPGTLKSGIPLEFKKTTLVDYVLCRLVTLQLFVGTQWGVVHIFRNAVWRGGLRPDGKVLCWTHSKVRLSPWHWGGSLKPSKTTLRNMWTCAAPNGLLTTQNTRLMWKFLCSYECDVTFLHFQWHCGFLIKKKNESLMNLEK